MDKLQMNIVELFEKIDDNIQINSRKVTRNPEESLSNEALFHLPLLAMTILLLAKSRSKPKLEEITSLVGQCLELSIPGYKHSSQNISWSANLRIRTVKALTFLEIKELIYTDSSKKIIASELGKKVIDRALAQESELSANLAAIQRSYRNICKENIIEATVR
ncbi:hypothetical protein [Pseudomonas fluorescens]|uniref:hypothetical protein n=1 Tax=Pseudomonas fluorescens TaxID=294 RepID=UPI001CD1AB89|nr:hypothetical protein [Pseudomonas fluorescens]